MLMVLKNISLKCFFKAEKLNVFGRFKFYTSSFFMKLWYNVLYFHTNSISYFLDATVCQRLYIIPSIDDCFHEYILMAPIYLFSKYMCMNGNVCKIRLFHSCDLNSKHIFKTINNVLHFRPYQLHKILLYSTILCRVDQ